jgi:DNA end-binding protein Ku
MSPRSIASLSISFGLVSIPIKLYSATESSAAIRFKLMGSGGARVRQQYVADVAPPPVSKTPVHHSAPEPEHAAPMPRSAASKLVNFPTARPALEGPPYEPPTPPYEAVIERSTMLKGYEYERGKFVLFTPEELKALEAGSRKTIDIVSFIPQDAVDPIYFDKAYLLAPDKRAAKPYNLLFRAMRDTGRCGLAKWAFRSKEYVVQIRAADVGIVLQQLFYADEVRSPGDLVIEQSDIGDAELELAKQLIEHLSVDAYDPKEFVDEEKQRILAAVAEKVAGKKMMTPAPAPATGGKVVDLLEALRASLQAKQSANALAKTSTPLPDERKPAKRASSKSAGAAAANQARPAKR